MDHPDSIPKGLVIEGTNLWLGLISTLQPVTMQGPSAGNMNTYVPHNFIQTALFLTVFVKS